MKLAAYSHSAADSPKTPSPTTHVTETSFLHVLDPPGHFGIIYIFDHFFTYIHNLAFTYLNETGVAHHFQRLPALGPRMR